MLKINIYKQRFKTTKQRFWEKVDKKVKDECWEWKAGLVRGYGSFWNNRNEKAPRFSWELHNEKIPRGIGYHGVCVLHKCDNRKCVNPKHLYLGTAKDNMKDKLERNRANMPKGEKHHNSKITEQVVKIIRELYKRPDLTQRDLAKDFNLGQTTISNIVNKKRWKHI